MKDIRTIVADLYENRQLNECLQKFVPLKHRDDFKQELFLILLENENTVLRAYADNKHLFYAVRIIINLVRQSKNIYQKEYLRREIVELKESTNIPCEESFPFEVRKFQEDKEDEIIKEIEGIDEKMGSKNFPFYEKLLRIVAEHGGIREASRRTGIPKSSVHRSVNRIRDHFKDRL